MYHTVSNNVNNNQLNDVIHDQLKFDSNYSLASDHINYKQPLVIINLSK